jgi:hypothetical protein
MNKKYVSYSIDKEVIKQVKVKMANLEMNNQSLLVENLLKQWLEQTK